MSKTFWAIIAVIVVIFGGILLFNGKDASAPNGGSSGNAKPTEHIRGESDLGLTLVEYGDYQCPYCGAFNPVVKEVEAKYAGKVKFQFRHLPLIQVHQNAFAAARAAEAAGNQGKFWEMHELIYQNQSAWSEDSNAAATFREYAKALKLDADKFKKDAASSTTNNVINADIKAFEKTGAEKSTPTFFLDGKKIQPADMTVEAFSKVVDPIIAKKESAKKQ
jgi:protein-disulfide isomerase